MRGVAMGDTVSDEFLRERVAAGPRWASRCGPCNPILLTPFPSHACQGAGMGPGYGQSPTAGHEWLKGRERIGLLRWCMCHAGGLHAKQGNAGSAAWEGSYAAWEEGLKRVVNTRALPSHSCPPSQYVSHPRLFTREPESSPVSGKGPTVIEQLANPKLALIA